MAISQRLCDCTVLILEDVYLVAEELRRALLEAGATVVGPFRDAAIAVATVDKESPSCALIDINLGEGASFVPAKALQGRGVPVAFVTGYGVEMIPPELSDIPHLQKPVNIEEVIDLVARLCSSSERRLAS